MQDMQDMQDHRRARRMKPRADGSCDGRAPAVFGSLLPVATVIPAILLLVCSGSALAMSSRRRVQVVESPSESSPLSDSSDSSEDSPVSGRTRDRAGSPSALSSTSSTSEASCAVGGGGSTPERPVRPKFHCSGGLQHNPRFAGVGPMKVAQQRQLSKFRAAAAAGRWARIHKDHFDWWMFPIEDGSQPGYNVYAEDVAALLADEEWVGGFTEGIEMVALAWGWELGASRPVSDPAAAAGQAWQDWDIRLAKMIRSAWLFGQSEARQSLQALARDVAPEGGLQYGGINLDEVFFMK